MPVFYNLYNIIMDINIKDLTEEQKEDLKNQLEEDETIKESKEKSEEKIDFSEYVGRCNHSLAIQCVKTLISTKCGTIVYGDTKDDFHRVYNDELHYKKTTLDELEKGDVFIRCCDVNYMTGQDFQIYVSQDCVIWYWSQHIDNTINNKVLLDTMYSWENYEVYKFLRE